MTDRLVLSVAEAAEALGVSDDLVYELTERGDPPCLRFGRRKVIPRQAIELLMESAVADYDTDAVLRHVYGMTIPQNQVRTAATESMRSRGSTAEAAPPFEGGSVPVTSERPVRQRRHGAEGLRGQPAADHGEGDAAELRLFEYDDHDNHCLGTDVPPGPKIE